MFSLAFFKKHKWAVLPQNFVMELRFFHSFFVDIHVSSLKGNHVPISISAVDSSYHRNCIWYSDVHPRRACTTARLQTQMPKGCRHFYRWTTFRSHFRSKYGYS